jgi:hypothetical protein
LHKAYAWLRCSTIQLSAIASNSKTYGGIETVNIAPSNTILISRRVLLLLALMLPASTPALEAAAWAPSVAASASI